LTRCTDRLWASRTCCVWMVTAVQSSFRIWVHDGLSAQKSTRSLAERSLQPETSQQLLAPLIHIAPGLNQGREIHPNPMSSCCSLTVFNGRADLSSGLPSEKCRDQSAAQSSNRHRHFNHPKITPLSYQDRENVLESSGGQARIKYVVQEAIPIQQTVLSRKGGCVDIGQ
jgi:hypothetical protein